MRRYALRDDQWERISALLPGKAGDRGRTASDNRLFVEAVLYRYRAGIPWRDLPERFGDFRVIHTRHMRWSKTGVWARLFNHLSQDLDNEYAMIDAAIVRAHQHAAGARGRSKNRMHRAIQRRIKHQNPRDMRCFGQLTRVFPDRWAGLRFGWCGSFDRRS